MQPGTDCFTICWGCTLPKELFGGSLTFQALYPRFELHHPRRSGNIYIYLFCINASRDLAAALVSNPISHSPLQIINKPSSHTLASLLQERLQTSSLLGICLSEEGAVLQGPRFGGRETNSNKPLLSVGSTQKLQRGETPHCLPPKRAHTSILPERYCLSIEVWELEEEMMEINHTFCFPFHSSNPNGEWRTLQPLSLSPSV